LRAPSLARVAPALVVTAGFDPLRDEGDAYARKLREAGVRVDTICYGGMIHGFVPMGRLIETGNRAVAHIAATLRQELQPPGGGGTPRLGCHASERPAPGAAPGRTGRGPRHPPPPHPRPPTQPHT